MQFTIKTIFAIVSLAIVSAAGLHASAETPSTNSPKPPPPVFNLMWREELDDPAMRLAVADVKGDGAPHLVLLISKPGMPVQSVFMVKKWTGTEFKTEYTTDVNAPPDKLAVGRFAGAGKPAVIVTADGAWIWDGATFKHKSTARPLAVFGGVRLNTGEEKLILSDSEKEFTCYSINAASDSDWLTGKTASPSGLQVEWESLRASTSFFAKMGMPDTLSSGGLITLWDVTKEMNPFIFYCRPAPELQRGTTRAKINSFVAFRDALEANGNEIWSTQKLDGLATDFAMEDPKAAGRRGLLILTSAASANHLRTLYFYIIQ